MHIQTKTPRKSLVARGLVCYPARIRTWTKRTKISCATVTLPGKNRTVLTHVFNYYAFASIFSLARFVAASRL